MFSFPAVKESGEVAEGFSNMRNMGLKGRTPGFWPCPAFGIISPRALLKFLGLPDGSIMGGVHTVPVRTRGMMAVGKAY